MKILICSEFYEPHIGGVEEHSNAIAKFFSSKGHHIEIVTSFLNERKTKKKNIIVNQFKISGNFVKGFRGETQKYQKFLLKKKFDIIFINAAQQWTCDLLLPIIHKINAKKIFFPCGFSRINNIFYKKYFEYLKTKINQFDEIICSSQNYQDYKFIKKYYKKKINIIPNGGSIYQPAYSKEKFMRKFNLDTKRKIICFISNIKFFKGQDRAISIFKSINNNNCTLFLIGNNFSYLFNLFIKFRVFLFNLLNSKFKNIILLSTSKAEASTILQYSDVFLFTSRLEYDPLVIKEAIISNKKFVSYDVGTIKQYAQMGYGFCSNDKSKLKIKLENFLKTKKKFKNKGNRYLWKNILQLYYNVFFKKNFESN